MDKLKYRKAALLIASMDVTFSIAALLCALVIIGTVATTDPADYNGDTKHNWVNNGLIYTPAPTPTTVSPATRTVRFYRKRYSDIWVYFGTAVFGLFNLLGVLAAIVLMKSTSPNESQGRALSMVWFWIYCNIPITLIDFGAGFILYWTFSLALLRPIYVYMVWKYLVSLRKFRLRDCINVPDSIKNRKCSQDLGERVDLVYNKRVKYMHRQCILSPEESQKYKEKCAKGWDIEVKVPLRNNLKAPACQCLGTGRP